MQLVERSDVLVENLKASALHAIGITESELLDRNPRLVVMRIPPAGLTGDWAHYKGFGAQFDGLSGLASMLGHAGSQLVDTPSTMYMDAATGPAGAFALLAALHYRDVIGPRRCARARADGERRAPARRHLRADADRARHRCASGTATPSTRRRASTAARAGVAGSRSP